MEAKPAEYHQKVREGFLQLAEEHDSIRVVDASGDIEAVHAKVVEEFKAFFSFGDVSG